MTACTPILYSGGEVKKATNSYGTCINMRDKSIANFEQNIILPTIMASQPEPAAAGRPGKIKIDRPCAAPRRLSLLLMTKDSLKGFSVSCFLALLCVCSLSRSVRAPPRQHTRPRAMQHKTRQRGKHREAGPDLT